MTISKHGKQTSPRPGRLPGPTPMPFGAYCGAIRHSGAVEDRRAARWMWRIAPRSEMKARVHITGKQTRIRFHLCNQAEPGRGKTVAVPSLQEQSTRLSPHKPGLLGPEHGKQCSDFQSRMVNHTISSHRPSSTCFRRRLAV